MDSYLRMYLTNKYNLFHRQKLNFTELKNIATNEKIELEDLYKVFDISGASKTKFRKGINANCFITIYSQNELNNFKDDILQNNSKLSLEVYKQKYKLTSRAINEIKNGHRSKSTLKLDLDIKYIYGDIFINKCNMQELMKMYCNDEEKLIKNISKTKKIYSAYKYAIENNKKGIYISQNTRISNKFINENYQKLNRYLEIKSNIKCNAYRCFDIKDDLKSEAYEKIIRLGGIYEKNIKNENMKMCYILNLAENSMNSYIRKRPKTVSLIHKIDEIEKEYEIPDNTYNPENIVFGTDLY